MRRLLREPLLHFLAAGAALYLLYGISAHDGAAAPRHRITVDRATLLQFMQYQARAFAPASFAAQLDAMDEQQRQQLVRDYVREEVLYREASALGLAQGDYVMRQRLVQKMTFVLEGQARDEPTDAQLRAYLEANRGLYQVAPAWTFTHVFVDSARHGSAQAEAIARALRATLNREHAGFNDAPRYTERFPFLQNYVERTGDYVASQFGPAFAAALASLPADSSHWQGPLRSEQGWHVVLVTGHAPGRMPGLGEIRAQLVDDYRRERAAGERERAIQALVASYQVEWRDQEVAQP
jgi:hypothetical protein